MFKPWLVHTNNQALTSFSQVLFLFSDLQVTFLDGSDTIPK